MLSRIRRNFQVNVEFLGAHENLTGVCSAAGADERLRKTIEKDGCRGTLSRRLQLQCLVRVKNGLRTLFRIPLHHRLLIAAVT
jgi:hypothetical protein